MDEAFSTYLKAINAGETLTECVDSSLTVFNVLCSEPIKSIFVSDRINRDTRERDLSSLWAFSDTYWLSTKNILTGLNADIAAYRNAIWYLGVDYKDLEIHDGALTSSYLFVEVAVGNIDRNELSATGANCSFLWGIVKDILRPNLRTELA